MGTGTHHHDTAFSIVKALGIVAVVISHAAILTPLETFTYYFNTAVSFFVAGYFFDDGQTATPGRFIGRKLRRLYLRICRSRCRLGISNRFGRLSLGRCRCRG